MLGMWCAEWSGCRCLQLLVGGRQKCYRGFSIQFQAWSSYQVVTRKCEYCGQLRNQDVQHCLYVEMLHNDWVVLEWLYNEHFTPLLQFWIRDRETGWYAQLQQHANGFTHIYLLLHNTSLFALVCAAVRVERVKARGLFWAGGWGQQGMCLRESDNLDPGRKNKKRQSLYRPSQLEPFQTELWHTLTNKTHDPFIQIFKCLNLPFD